MRQPTTSGGSSTSSTGRRRVIVNADDLGLSDAVNEGILLAHTAGVVTSASLMVVRPAAVAAVEAARSHPDLSIGLHLDLVEYQVVDDAWQPTLVRVDLGDPEAVDAEVRSQLRRFVELTASRPTHLDSHQHCHNEPGPGAVIAAVAAEWGIPLRGVSLPYIGSFYGQYGVAVPYPEGVTTDALLGAITAGDEMLAEVGCHPAVDVDHTDTYGAERVAELAALTDPALVGRIAGCGVDLVNRSGRTRSRASAGHAVS